MQQEKMLIIPFADAGCNHGDVRLVDGNSQMEGRLEVCLNDAWGTVSNFGFFDGAAARVVCNQLGYSNKG